MNLVFECNSPDVVFENFGDEVILLNLQSGRYYSLNPVGMFFWELLTQGVAQPEISARIEEQYAGATGIGADLDGLLAEFRAEELIRPAATATPLAQATPPKTALPPAYAPPVLAKFDDVAEMLLLDPVHDVTDAGWPHPAPPVDKAKGA